MDLQVILVVLVILLLCKGTSAFVSHFVNDDDYDSDEDEMFADDYEDDEDDESDEDFADAAEENKEAGLFQMLGFGSNQEDFVDDDFEDEYEDDY